MKKRKPRLPMHHRALFAVVGLKLHQFLGDYANKYFSRKFLMWRLSGYTI
jgi:hypothetical protein